MDQQPDTLGQRSGYRDLSGVKQCDNVPPELLGGSSREGGVQIASHREQRAHDVVRLEVIRGNDRAQELVRCGENLIRTVPVDCGRSPDSVEASGWRHAT